MTKPQYIYSKGNCFFCGKIVQNMSTGQHLNYCRKRKEAIASIEANPNHSPCSFHYHLRIADTALPTFWLHLEMNGTAILADLAFYLHLIWLECCQNHNDVFLSGIGDGFEIVQYAHVDEILFKDMKFSYAYDFKFNLNKIAKVVESHSIMRIKVVNVRYGPSLSHQPIILMARNLPPEALCQACGKEAQWICPQCLCELKKPGTFCNKCIKLHTTHKKYGEPYPIVNSPRMGICNYHGPAIPPY